jgi:hypothetical protein
MIVNVDGGGGGGGGGGNFIPYTNKKKTRNP